MCVLCHRLKIFRCRCCCYSISAIPYIHRWNGIVLLLNGSAGWLPYDHTIYSQNWIIPFFGHIALVGRSPCTHVTSLAVCVMSYLHTKMWIVQFQLPTFVFAIVHIQFIGYSPRHFTSTVISPPPPTHGAHVDSCDLRLYLQINTCIAKIDQRSTWQKKKNTIWAFSEKRYGFAPYWRMRNCYDGRL